MTPYLAPRSSQRPGSATLQRRIQVSTARAKTFTPHSKSVRFQEEKSAGKNFSRSMSTKESKFHFPWKKKKDEEGHVKPSEVVFSASICDSPSSVRSAPSTVGQSVSRGKKVYSPVHSMDGSEMRARSPATSDVDNVYDLYAVCNHTGTMTRGHYTAFCRNPADGHWYRFDDNHVQSLSEDQLVTAGAYLLFYVRQSLLNQMPPLSSTSSSSSSGSSNHWAMHIPRFRLDLNGSLGSSETPYTPNINEVRQRFESTTSAPPISAPNIYSRGFSPLSSAQDSVSDVFVQSRGGTDSHSAVSLPPSTSTTPLHLHQLSSPTYHPPSNHLHPVSSARHASLRVSRPRHLNPDNSGHDEQFMRRGSSFHGSSQHQTVQRSLTDSGRVLEMPAHPAYPSSGQGLAMPSRSIPNVMAADYPVGIIHNPYHAPMPSRGRSIPDMPCHMSPPPPARPNIPQDPAAFFFMTPQPHRARTFSAGQSGTESCV